MCAVRVKKEKHVTSMGQNREPTIRSCDTGQRIPCFSSSTWMCNIIQHYLTTNISRMDRTKIFLAMGLRYNLLLPRRTDSWLPPPSPRVGRVSVRSYADVITKFCRMDRLPNFLSCSYTFARGEPQLLVGGRVLFHWNFSFPLDFQRCLLVLRLKSGENIGRKYG